MRIKVKFYINKTRELRQHINKAVTGYFYKCLTQSDEEFAKKIHDGYDKKGHKKYTYFTYNLSQNKHRVADKLEEGIAVLTISSDVKEIIAHFVRGMAKLKKIQLFGQSYNILEATQIKTKKFTEVETFNTLSPVYFSDVHRNPILELEEFNKIMNERVKEKYFIRYKKFPEPFKLELISKNITQIEYKTEIFKGHIGTVLATGDKTVLEFIYNAGLGEKCGIGLGFLDRN